jgi:hypothetical protein
MVAPRVARLGPLPRALSLRDMVKMPDFGAPPRIDDLVHDQAAIRRNEWGELMRGRSVGKKTNLLYTAGESVAENAPVSLFEIGASDLDACQLQVTLTQPLAIPATAAQIAAALGGVQDMTGELSNLTVGTADYPGTAEPISWPPFACILEWGTGARTYAIVDFMNGQTVNLSASWVRAYALAPTDAENTPGTSGVYSFLAFIGPGFPKSLGAQRSIQLGSIAGPSSMGVPAESGIFITPPYARRVSVISCDTSQVPPAVTVATISFFQDPLGANNVGNYLVTGNQPGPFPVPNAGMYFNVTSGMGAAAKFIAVFELSI